MAFAIESYCFFCLVCFLHQISVEERERQKNAKMKDVPKKKDKTKKVVSDKTVVVITFFLPRRTHCVPHFFFFFRTRKSAANVNWKRRKSRCVRSWSKGIKKWNSSGSNSSGKNFGRRCRTLR